MNEILQFLNSHASVRRFTTAPISAEDEEIILYTAQRSPTSSNIHAYSVISVRDQQKKNRLAGLCGDQQHVSDAQLFLVFCADLYRLRTLNESRSYPFDGSFAEQFIVATVDATLVAGRALQAAQALGFGGVMVGGIRNNPQEISELLGLPDLVYPVMGMSLGYPESPARIKPRLPLTAVNFRESYDPTQFAPAIAEYDRMINELGYLDGREVRKDDYPEFEGIYSWSEHTARRMADVDGPTMRPHMLAFLQKRGFLNK